MQTNRFKYGIEHEVAFMNVHGGFADFTNTSFQDLQQIVDDLPDYRSDYPQLRIGDAGIKVKRWYIEGFERFSEKGEMIDCLPKGIEIRTTIHTSINATIFELEQSMKLLKDKAIECGFFPIITSYNPVQSKFDPVPPLNEYERKRRSSSPEKQTAYIPLLTYGPDLSISNKSLSTQEIIDIGQKLTFYSPFIIPFSYSSPFTGREIGRNLSQRTFVRTGQRPAVMVFLEKEEDLIQSNPSLTKIARIPAEIGRIEFKAFDSCSDFKQYASLLELMKGIILDKTLAERAIVPDTNLHQLSAENGFNNETIYEKSSDVLKAAQKALKNDEDCSLLDPLFDQLQKRESLSHWMKTEALKKSNNMEGLSFLKY